MDRKSALYDLIASSDKASIAMRGPLQIEQKDGKPLVQAQIEKETDLVLAWA